MDQKQFPNFQTKDLSTVRAKMVRKSMFWAIAKKLEESIGSAIGCKRNLGHAFAEREFI